MESQLVAVHALACQHRVPSPPLVEPDRAAISTIRVVTATALAVAVLGRCLEMVVRLKLLQLKAQHLEVLVPVPQVAAIQTENAGLSASLEAPMAARLLQP